METPHPTSPAPPNPGQPIPAVSKKTFAAWKIMLPVAIGLAVVVLMLRHDAKEENLADIWKSISITPRTVIFILLGFLCMFGRDFGLIRRFRALTSR